MYVAGRGDGISMSSIDPELKDGESGMGVVTGKESLIVGSLPSGAHNLGISGSGRRHGPTGLSRSRSGRGSRPFSHPHSHYGKSGDHSITQFAEMDDANVSALQQITRGGGGLTMASQWKSQFDDNDETDNEWKGVEQLQSPEHKGGVSISQVG
jgi:hypothetical protein